MDWKAVVSNVAPTIATALGGPIAGTAVKFLASEFLGDESATEKQIAESIINASPDQLVKLRELDNAFSVRMAELDIDVYRIQADDRKSARDLAKVNMWPQIILSFAFISGYFTLTHVIFSGNVDIPEGLDQTANILLGVLTGAIPMILQFWFGTSTGSKEKAAKMVLK